MSRRQLLLLAALFFVARLTLVLCSADRLSEPDAAEVKLMELGDAWIRSGEFPGIEQVLRLARAGTNAPHGTYLPVSLLYAVIAVPLGEPGNYLALKLVGILFATAGLLVWVMLAGQLGEGRARRRAALAVGLLLFFPPPAFLAGSLVPWGSHPEAVFFLGLAALLVLGLKAEEQGALRAIGAALALALALGMNLLVAPMVAVLTVGWAWDMRETRRHLIVPALLAAGLLVLIFWTTGSPWASVTESAGASPLELAQGRQGGGLSLTLRSLGALIPLPLAVTGGAQGAGLINWVLTGIFVIGLGGTLHSLSVSRPSSGRSGRLWSLFLAAPLAHLLCLSLWAPRRPFIPPRYLLPLIPILLLGLACAWASSEGRRRRISLGVALALVLIPGLRLQLSLFEPSRIDGFAEYRPAAWLAEDIGHVRYEEAPAVNRFLEGRGAGRAVGFNFAAGMGASDALLGEPHDSARLDAAALLARRDDSLAEQPLSDEERGLLHQNIGWGMAVFAPSSTGTWHAVLSRLEGDDRIELARGIGMALAFEGTRGCEVLRNSGGPDRDAIASGFAAIRPLGECGQ
jgi:hypothetical protein